VIGDIVDREAPQAVRSASSHSISFFLCGSVVLWLGAEIATVPRSFRACKLTVQKRLLG
jgi:hypothetical protein